MELLLHQRRLLQEEFYQSLEGLQEEHQLVCELLVLYNVLDLSEIQQLQLVLVFLLPHLLHQKNVLFISSLFVARALLRPKLMRSTRSTASTLIHHREQEESKDGKWQQSCQHLNPDTT